MNIKVIGCILMFTGVHLTAAWSQIIYENDFSQPKNFKANTNAYYQDGAYHIYANQNTLIPADTLFFTDFIMEIRTEFMGGSSGHGYGMVFRYKDNGHHYSFGISANGSYYVGKVKNDKWVDILPWKEDHRINSAGINYLRVQCKNDSIILFANGKMLARIKDSDYKQGSIGMVTYGSSHVHFDDLKVFKNESAIPEHYTYIPETLYKEYDLVPRNNCIFYDDFMKKVNHWSESPFAFRENGYFIIDDYRAQQILEQKSPQRDYYIELIGTVERFGVMDGWAGIAVRSHPYQNYFGFVINTNKSASIMQSKTGYLSTVTKGFLTDFSEGEPFKLSGECRGDSLKLYVDDKLIISAEDRTGLGSDFGLIASSNTRFIIHSMQVIPLAPEEAASDDDGFWGSACWISSAVIIGFFVFLIIIGQRSINADKRKKASENMVQYITSHHGVVRLKTAARDMNVSEEIMKTVLEEAALKMNGQPAYLPDGDINYDFPDYMRSDEDYRALLRELAKMRNQGFLAEEAAEYLEKNVDQTVAILNELIRKGGVTAKEKRKKTYYFFDDISGPDWTGKS